ncbi:MAG: 5-(carboxyamino)imidazole ribonucleotide synthase, partial [Phycisphaeraceae bacterium]
YGVHVFSPDTDTPTGHVADLEIKADYDDLDAVAAFAKGVSVVSFEFENVPAATAQAAARHAPLRPEGHVLHTTQHRVREKNFLRSAGLPVAPFAAVRHAGEVRAALREIGTPAVLKTASWGYDGKGQIVIPNESEAASAWDALGTDEAVVEAFIDFDCELSVVAARGIDGEVVCYAPSVNTHRNHILDLSVSPAPVPAETAADAVEIARTVLEKLGVVGVMCIEFFLTRNGRLMINELAPRPHNSGHLTIDAHVTCQFEQQLRAICGLPLGSVRPHGPAAMANLLGDLWMEGEMNWRRVAAMDDVKIHLYGKREARRGRKMGHLTVLADTAEAAATRVLEARAALH